MEPRGEDGRMPLAFAKEHERPDVYEIFTKCLNDAGREHFDPRWPDEPLYLTRDALQYGWDVVEQHGQPMIYPRLSPEERHRQERMYRRPPGQLPPYPSPEPATPFSTTRMAYQDAYQQPSDQNIQSPGNNFDQPPQTRAPGRTHVSPEVDKGISRQKTDRTGRSSSTEITLREHEAAEPNRPLQRDRNRPGIRDSERARRTEQGGYSSLTEQIRCRSPTETTLAVYGGTERHRIRRRVSDSRQATQAERGSSSSPTETTLGQCGYLIPLIANQTNLSLS